MITAAKSGRSSSYQLNIERAAGKLDFIKASNAGSDDSFGFAISRRSLDLFGATTALSADAIIVGANGDASSSRGIDGDADRTDAALSGAAYIFGLQGSEYVQSAYLGRCDEQLFSHRRTLRIQQSTRHQRAQDRANGADNSVGASGAVYVYR